MSLTQDIAAIRADERAQQAASIEAIRAVHRGPPMELDKLPLRAQPKPGDMKPGAVAVYLRGNFRGWASTEGRGRPSDKMPRHRDYERRLNAYFAARRSAEIGRHAESGRLSGQARRKGSITERIVAKYPVLTAQGIAAHHCAKHLARQFNGSVAVVRRVIHDQGLRAAKT